MVKARRLTGALGIACSVLDGCSGAGEQDTVVVTSTSFVAETPASAPLTPKGPSPEPTVTARDAQALLDATVADVTAAFGGELGVATMGERGPVTAGFADPTPAWSTMKVPIAVAATRTQPGLESDVRAAITVSDNEAAGRLFDAVGPDAVDSVLSEAGVPAQVNMVDLRPEFSTFGQTLLSAADEAVLADSLPCVDGSGSVLGYMGQVEASQRYGLGAVGALFKGGWGPDTAGRYHVRQLGLIPRANGVWSPVALTAIPADGTYQTGQAMLTAAATRLAQASPALPAARCQP